MELVPTNLDFDLIVYSTKMLQSTIRAPSSWEEKNSQNWCQPVLVDNLPKISGIKHEGTVRDFSDPLQIQRWVGLTRCLQKGPTCIFLRSSPPSSNNLWWFQLLLPTLRLRRQWGQASRCVRLEYRHYCSALELQCLSHVPQREGGPCWRWWSAHGIWINCCILHANETHFSRTTTVVELRSLGPAVGKSC